MELELVEVLRKCRDCGIWKPIGSFGGRLSRDRPRHRCHACCLPVVTTGEIARARGMAITPAGRDLLAEWKAEQGAA